MAVTIYQHFQASRTYSYKDQITRSALSIASNVAEGYERTGENGHIKFLNYAKRSCRGLRTQMCIDMEAGLISRETGRDWIKETQELSRMLYDLMKALGKH